MMVYILMLNTIKFGTESFFQNLLTQQFKYSEKLLVTHSFLLILPITLMHTFLTLTPIVHIVLENVINSSTSLHFLHQHGLLMLSLHSLVIHVTNLDNVENIFLHFFSYKLFLPLIKVSKTISIKYKLQQDTIIFNSIAHAFFNILTAELVNDLKTLLLKTLDSNKRSSKFFLSTVIACCMFSSIFLTLKLNLTL